MLPIDPPEVHNAKVEGWTRLFMYVQAVAKEIGEEKMQRKAAALLAVLP